MFWSTFDLLHVQKALRVQTKHDVCLLCQPSVFTFSFAWYEKKRTWWNLLTLPAVFFQISLTANHVQAVTSVSQKLQREKKQNTSCPTDGQQRPLKEVQICVILFLRELTNDCVFPPNKSKTTFFFLWKTEALDKRNIIFFFSIQAYISSLSRIKQWKGQIFFLWLTHIDLNVEN